jgi:hypothetical protein
MRRRQGARPTHPAAAAKHKPRWALQQRRCANCGSARALFALRSRCGGLIARGEGADCEILAECQVAVNVLPAELERRVPAGLRRTPTGTHSAVHVLRAALSTYGWVTEPRCMRSAEGCAQGAARRSRFTTTHCCRLSDQPTDWQNAPTGRREACCAAWPLGTTGGCARRTVDLSGLRTCSICTASVARTHALWCRSTCGAVAQWRMERSVTCGACRVRPAYPRGLTTHGAGRVSHTAGRRRRTRASSRA